MSLLAIMSVLMAGAPAVPPPAAPLPPTAVDGGWTIDLRPRPDAPAYLKSMHLKAGAKNMLTGDFYDHPIEAGHVNGAEGKACFAFRTSDPSGPYQTSGCVFGTTVHGQTWSEGRNFLLIWTGTREQP